MAIWWSETDCMMAEAKGMLSRIAGCSPRSEPHQGGLKGLTAEAVQSLRVRLGMRRYSLKVWEGS